MKLIAFAVLDDKSGGYGHPFFSSAPGQAMRLFGDWAMDRQTPIGRHPGDYQLFSIGSFDDESGRLSSHETPVFLCRGSEFVGPRVLASDSEAVPVRKEERR